MVTFIDVSNEHVPQRAAKPSISGFHLKNVAAVFDARKWTDRVSNKSPSYRCASKYDLNFQNTRRTAITLRMIQLSVCWLR